MKIYKLENHKELYTRASLVRLMEYSMFNPTLGRIKSAAEGVYNKQQGKLYVAEDEEYLGLIGVKRTDNKKVDILHFAVEKEYRNNGIGRKLIEAVIEIERVDEIHINTNKKDSDYFRKIGFKVLQEEDKFTGEINYICIYKCK